MAKVRKRNHLQQIGSSGDEHLEADFISYSEAGRILNRSPQTIRRWVLEGLIASIREPTGRHRVKREDLRRFIDGSNLEGEVQ